MFRRKVVPLASGFRSPLELLSLQIYVIFYHLRDWTLQKSNLQGMNIVRALCWMSVVCELWCDGICTCCVGDILTIWKVFSRAWNLTGVWVRKQYLLKKLLEAFWISMLLCVGSECSWLHLKITFCNIIKAKSFKKVNMTHLLVVLLKGNAYRSYI